MSQNNGRVYYQNTLNPSQKQWELPTAPAAEPDAACAAIGAAAGAAPAGATSEPGFVDGYTNGPPLKCFESDDEMDQLIEASAQILATLN